MVLGRFEQAKKEAFVTLMHFCLGIALVLAVGSLALKGLSNAYWIATFGWILFLILAAGTLWRYNAAINWK